MEAIILTITSISLTIGLFFIPNPLQTKIKAPKKRFFRRNKLGQFKKSPCTHANIHPILVGKYIQTCKQCGKQF